MRHLMNGNGPRAMRAALIALTLIATVSGSSAADRSGASSPVIAPLGPPGASANAFPKPARPVASIVSDKYSSEETRDHDGEAEKVMNSLGVAPGMTVADIGAGAGYYTVRLAQRIGPTGRVIAEDVIPAYLEQLQGRVAEEHLDNVTLALGEPHDPRLPPHAVDLVLMVHMYHEVEQPYGLLYNLLPALHPGARVAVIDLNQPTERHGTPRALLSCEFQALGFRQISWTWIGGDTEYLAVFEPPAKPPDPRGIMPCSS